MQKTKSENKPSYDRYAIWLFDKLQSNQGSSKYYFVTLSFSKSSINRQRRSTEGCAENAFEFDGFNLLYNRVCRKLIGRNYHRQINHIRLPRVIACIDVSGTRFWRSPGEIENKLIHSVWKIPQADQPAFEKLISSYKLHLDLKKLIDLDGFDHQEIKPTDLQRVVAYSSKFLKFNEREILIEEDLRVYPMAIGGREFKPCENHQLFVVYIFQRIDWGAFVKSVNFTLQTRSTPSRLGNQKGAVLMEHSRQTC